MSKSILPIYNINNLGESLHSSKDFVADYFAHYLDTHQNLHFPHKHSFYHLVYFSKGSGSHSIDFVNFPVEAGQIYFMIPWQVHSWDFKTMPDGYIVNFSEQFMSALVSNPRYLDQFHFLSGTAKDQVITIPKKEKNKIEQTLDLIVKEGNSSLPLKDDFTRTALIQLLIQISRYPVPNNGKLKSSFNSVLLRNFQKLIELHYKEKKLSKEYAAMLYVTPNHLNALCKDAVGYTAGELIRNRVLLEAKRLLVNANLTISEIAIELDFTDNSYFTKFFKKYEGITPDAFRKIIHKK
jgi:AraC family transcriptional regulator, transcriptional activator of pobA